MKRRFQFSLRALLIAMLCAAFFFGGIRFERERRRRADEAAANASSVPTKIYGGMIVQPFDINRSSSFGTTVMAATIHFVARIIDL